ncbi:sigma-70 family RNA polymerase sigma factor [Cohnella sp. CFH 77786]|uniref:RNA polymerase sigma factor n=1 Tax=Cohnella sp. CFH 77786 TaxID=2662265 RepID=UPI001C610BD1|nr:RNA polymerase sigma factor [Cohnella sp. CFH 77786]MBW5447396.1 sigma-70 family RNA polymerase sigma factor [Cohnella sp. CFH 77786]
MIGSASTERNTTETGSPGWSRLHASLARYCLSLTGSRWDAEDLVQDTWVKALGTLQGTGHRNAEAFMLRIAKNTWIDQTRRKKALSQLLRLVRPESAEADGGAFELESAFAALVKHLSPLQRTVFLLRDVFGYSNAETAGMLRTTEGAAKAALRRARLALNAVKEDLRNGWLPEPKDEDLKIFLRALAAAYRNGDIARLAELAQQDVLHPVSAVGIAQGRLLRIRQTDPRPSAHPTARMAA